MRRNGQPYIASATASASAQPVSHAGAQAVPFAAVLGGAGRGANVAAARTLHHSGGGRGAGGGGGQRGQRGGGVAAAAAAAAVEDVGSGGEEEDEEDEEGEQKKPGRRKISIQFIEDKSKRHITFSKRKAGVIKKVSQPHFPAAGAGARTCLMWGCARRKCKILQRMLKSAVAVLLTSSMSEQACRKRREDGQ